MAGPVDVEQLKALGRAEGLDAVGIAPADPLLRARAALEARKAAGLHAGMAFTYKNPARSTTPTGLVRDAKAIVVGARRYAADPPPRPGRGPQGRVARYAWADRYAPLRDALWAVAGQLRRAGWKAVVFADDNSLVDREVAHRAGLGWYGKNANLLLPGQGSWFVLGSVVTDAPLPPEPGPVADGCGSCRRCLDGCPTGAIVAPGVVDANRCLAWLVQRPGTFPAEHRVALHDRIYGCDDCQEVCPPNRRHGTASSGGTTGHGRSSGAADPVDAWVDLLELLDADDATLLARHGRWYLADRDPRWLRRNALVALGNVADSHDERVAAVLERYLHHADPVLRAHAAWAAGRLNRADLVALVAGDPDPQVRAELAVAPRGMTHLLVTNDFPPKHGGIQSYLWELWRRLPPDEVVVLTTPFAGAERFDREQPFRIERVAKRVMLPTRRLQRRIDQLADETGAGFVLVDPALPLGLVAPRLSRPYGVLVHGAELVVPGAVPGSRALLRRVLRGAQLVMSSGEYPAGEARRIMGPDGPPVLSIPPGVDTDRYRPLDAAERSEARRRLDLPDQAVVVLGLSRLVPRKGFDVLLRAAARLAPRHPDLLVVIAGGGRDRRRLEALASRAGAPARFLGRVPDDDLPSLYGCSDVFAMLARSRWRGLEQEGFGIVFLEAAAAGIAQLGGASGGVPEAIVDGETGLVVDPPDDDDAAAVALARLLDDPACRARLGEAARRRAVADFDHDLLATRLQKALASLP